jgi:hypothetical protein
MHALHIAVVRDQLNTGVRSRGNAGFTLASQPNCRTYFPGHTHEVHNPRQMDRPNV